jgi:hypothetical protein
MEYERDNLRRAREWETLFGAQRALEDLDWNITE